MKMTELLPLKVLNLIGAFSGEAVLHFVSFFFSLLKRRQLLIEIKSFPLKENGFPLKVDPHIEKSMSCKEANRISPKLFPKVGHL